MQTCDAEASDVTGRAVPVLVPVARTNETRAANLGNPAVGQYQQTQVVADGQGSAVAAPQGKQRTKTASIWGRKHHCAPGAPGTSLACQDTRHQQHLNVLNAWVSNGHTNA